MKYATLAFAMAAAFFMSNVSADTTQETDIKIQAYLAFSFHNISQFSFTLAPGSEGVTGNNGKATINSAAFFDNTDAGHAELLCEAARKSTAEPASGDCTGYVMRQYKNEHVRSFYSDTMYYRDGE